MKTIAIDFDGVLSDYHGWQGETVLDPPLPGAIQWLAALALEKDFSLVIFTTREPALIKNWLETWALVELGDTELAAFPERIELTNTKPPAWLYIDDRCYLFTGTYPTKAQIESFKPWWQHDEGPLPFQSKRAEF